MRPVVELGQAPREETPAHWAEEEFGAAKLYDNRLKRRLYTIAQDFFNRCEARRPAVLEPAPLLLIVFLETRRLTWR
jgi:hypothetical protein